jgi:hypothetical protein
MRSGNEENRRMMVARANSDEAGMFRRLADFGGYVIGDTFSEANRGLSGRVVRDIARERNADPFDTLVDIVTEDKLRRSCGHRRPTTTRRIGRCASHCGTTPMCCSADPTPARTSTVCAEARTRRSSSPT